MEDTDVAESRTDVDGNRKRKKFFGDERLHRNRERNRMHARKTRERKKQQSNALQTRLSELEDEGKKLRQIVDDRYTASVLLGLSQTFQNSMGENHNILSSANVCNAMNSCPNANANSARRLTVASNLSGSEPDSNVPHDNTDENSKQNGTTKRVRRRGKYTPQERERIRRERNRMHAKRTRDRKKKLLEDSETIISRMERESHLLRGYCVSLNMISMEDATRCEERASESKRELAALKASQGEYDVDCDEDDGTDFNHNDEDGDGDDEHDNDGSLSGSDDNEKSCSWNGSNNDNESMDSLNGDTSGDASSSGSNSSSKDNNSGDDSNNNSSSVSSSSHSHSHNSSGSGSGSGGDSPLPKHVNNDWKAEKTFNYGTKPPNTYNTKPNHSNNVYPPSHAHAVPVSSPRCEVATSSQSVESYNHGNKPERVPPATVSSVATLSVVEIKATLAAADYFKNQIPGPSQPRSFPLRPTPVAMPESYSLSLTPHTGLPYIKKVKNILLSVIPVGISAPMGEGGVSPQGVFTPIPTILNSQVAVKWHHQPLHDEIHRLGTSIEYRNLPSSNVLNALEPL